MNFDDPEVRYRMILIHVLAEAMESLQDCDSRKAYSIISKLKSKANKGEVASYYESLVFNENAKPEEMKPLETGVDSNEY